MLVLPPEESIRVSSHSGFDPRGLGFERPVKRKKSVMYQFGESKIFGPLPPASSRPKGIEPLRAFVVGEKLGSNSPYVQEPYRMHLFFGGNADAFNNLQVLANDLSGLRADVERALPGKVFCAANRDDDDIASLDSWLCSIHWWAWIWTGCPYRTKPQVVYAGRTYPTDPGDDAVKSKLSFSMFDCDVLAASAATLSMILGFLEEPSEGIRPCPAQPDVPEVAPHDTQTRGIEDGSQTAAKTDAMLATWNALTDRQRNCMRAMLELRAFDPDSRRGAAEIAVKAEGLGANVVGFKEPLSLLVSRHLAGSKTGRKGGYWIAGSGREVLAVANVAQAADNGAS